MASKRCLGGGVEYQHVRCLSASMGSLPPRASLSFTSPPSTHRELLLRFLTLLAFFYRSIVTLPLLSALHSPRLVLFCLLLLS